MKLFLLLLGFVMKYKYNKKHKLYDINELQKYPMNMFEKDVFFKFKPYYSNISGYDNRLNETLNNSHELYCIRRLFYIHNLLNHLQSNIHDNNKLDLINEYNKYDTDSLFIQDITAAGLFTDWNNEFSL
jgi:hypothetical protein